MKKTATEFIMDENQIEAIEGMSDSFPYTMHRRDLTHFTVPWHWHEEVEFNYPGEGAIVVDTLNASYTIHQGEAYFINANVMNTKRKATECQHAVEHAHLFHPVLLSGHFNSIYQSKYLNPLLKNQNIEVLVITPSTQTGKEFIRNLKMLTRIQELKNQEFQIRNLLSETWLVLMEEARQQLTSRNLPRQNKQDCLRSMLSYIHQNYTREITLAEIALSANISERECSRLFKNVLCKTPFEYILEYRIEAAKKLLAGSSDSITDIALGVGFGGSAYFGKVFKRFCHITPSEFRDKFMATNSLQKERNV